MSGIAIEPTGATPPDPAAAAAGASGDGGTQTPEGFVPKADFERAEAQRRETQRQLDLTKNQLVQATAGTPAPAPVPAGSDADFDPVAFRRQLLGEVAQVTAVQGAAVRLLTEFPHADPDLFGARLAEFGSVDALRLAAEASHLRVASVIAGEKATIEAQVRAEMAAAHGGGSGQPGIPGTPGDPTPAELAGYSIEQMDALEAKNPGVLDRVMRSA